MAEKNLWQNGEIIKLFQLFLLVLAIFFVVLMFNLPKDVQKEVDTISVNGTGEITAVADTVSISLSVVTENADLIEALKENSNKMNEVISFLKSYDIEDKDIKTTNYSISPRYEYDENWNNRHLVGYEIYQTVGVKIRDLSKVGEIIAGATNNGVNTIGQLQFVIDDDEALIEQAKNEAIADAKSQAANLEQQLGVKLSKIVGFYESGTTVPSPYNYARAVSAVADEAAIAPTIEAGENTITSSITIVYEIEN